MKFIYLFTLVLCVFSGKAQKVDSIFVNLYTDSLKSGTYNYINVDGLLSNGAFLPLDSNDIIFTSSQGKFYGNSLWIDSSLRAGKVKIKVALKHNEKMCKEFVMFIKTKPDNEPLMDNRQYLEKLKKEKRKIKEKSI